MVTADDLPIQGWTLTDERLIEWAIGLVVMLILVTSVAWLVEGINAIRVDMDLAGVTVPGGPSVTLAHLTIFGGLFGLATAMFLQQKHWLGLVGAVIYLPARYFNFVIFTFGVGAHVEITLLGLVFLGAGVLVGLSRAALLGDGNTTPEPNASDSPTAEKVS